MKKNTSLLCIITLTIILVINAAAANLTMSVEKLTNDEKVDEHIVYYESDTPFRMDNGEGSPLETDEEEICYHTGNIDGAYGNSGGGTLEYAIRLTPTELVQYSGWSIHAVTFYHWESDQNSVDVKIYDEGTPTSPGSLLYTQSFTLDAEGWTRLDLTTPLLLDTTRDLWVALFITFNPGFPMGYDGSVQIPGQSAWYKPTGGTFTDVGDFCSWSIGAVVQQTFQWNHDVSILNINDPESGTGHIITPDITIRNRGLSDEEDVPTLMKISYWEPSLEDWIVEYDETMYIDIESGETFDFEFPEWTPVVWGTENVDVDYLIEAEVQLPGDEDPYNDYLSKEISLHFDFLHNLGVNDIVSPFSGRPEEFTPEIVVENYGQNDETDVTVGMTIQRLTGVTMLFEEDFESGIPGTWTITDGYSDGATWRDDNPWGRTPPPSSNCDGTFVICDELYEETPMDEYLTSPIFSCIGETTVMLNFGSYFKSTSLYDQYGEVEVFDGATWTSVYYVTGTSEYAQDHIDLTALLVGKSTAQIRFHFFSTDWAYFWMVDNIQIYGASFITEYEETQDHDIASSEVKSIAFSEWTPWTPTILTTDIEYMISGEVELDQGVIDGDPSDNTLLKWIMIEHVHDIGVVEITEPSETPSFDEDWLYFHNGYGNNGIGLTSGGTFEAAMRLTPDELEGYNNRKIDIVNFYHHETGAHSGNIKIYAEGTSVSPGDLITSEPYTVVGSGWHEIELTNPAIIIDEEDLWVSVEITHSSGEYPMALDFGPAVTGKGDWIYYGSGWEELSGSGYSYNWCIEAHVKERIEFEPGTYPVEAIVANYGTFDESYFNVNASIYKLTGEGNELFYQDIPVVTQTLGPGDDATVQFAEATFTDTDEGTYLLKITSELSDDDVVDNNQQDIEFIINIPDTTPPQTTHELQGDEGDNGWYIGDVTIVLSAEDRGPSGVEYTYYKVDDGEYALYDEDHPPQVSADGEHTFYYYSVDYAGNDEDINGPFSFMIDQTVPTIELSVEKTGAISWLLTADVSDETSGVAKVEFYVDGEYVGEDTEGPDYEYEWSGVGGTTAQAIVYDNAGNAEISPIVDTQVLSNDNQQRHTVLQQGSRGFQTTLLKQ